MMPSVAIDYVGRLKRGEAVEMELLVDVTTTLRTDYSIRRQAMRIHGVDDEWFLIMFLIQPEEGRDEEQAVVPPRRLDRHDKRDKRFI